MPYLIWIIVGIVIGLVLAGWFVIKKAKRRNLAQSRQKEANKRKILAALRRKGAITNDEVEKLIGVGHTSAFKYLEELEKEGKITQQGATGRSVKYVLVDE